jgi:type I restriction enzyme, R subunit
VAEAAPPSYIPAGPVDIIERAHPDLGRLGVFWHTQGSGKSYSMAFFAEKVRRKVPGNFTFLLMTDRRTSTARSTRPSSAAGCRKETPRAARAMIWSDCCKENHRTSSA